MKVLLAGGAGMVGSFITPYLKEWHDLRMVDLAEPRHDDVEVVKESVTNSLFVAGDEDEKEHNLSKARRLLGWTPQSHIEIEP